jgi:hypothetical protein
VKVYHDTASTVGTIIPVQTSRFLLDGSVGVGVGISHVNAKLNTRVSGVHLA